MSPGPVHAAQSGELLDVADLAAGQLIVAEQELRLRSPGFLRHGLDLAPSVEAAGIHGGALQMMPAGRLHAAGPGQLRKLRQVILDLVRPVLGSLMGEEETAEEAFCHGSRVADFL